MEKFRYNLMRFMQGRYGSDSLNLFIIGLAFVFSIINIFIKHIVFSLISYVLIFYAIFRLMSKNIWERQKENQSYLTYTKAFRDKINLLKRNLKDKEHKYFYCPNCAQMVRVPRRKGKITITCPKCHNSFDRKS